MKTFFRENNQSAVKREGLPLKKLVIITFFLNIGVLCLAFLVKPLLPPQIPLYYGMAEVNKIIAPSWALIVPSLASLVIFGVNFILGLFLDDDYAQKALILASFASILFAIITSLKIIFLVGNL